MISSIKYQIRRAAQKIMGLDADNSEIEKLNKQITDLKSELENIKNDFLFNPNLIPYSLDKFSEPADFFTQEDKLVSELISLGYLNHNTKVAELMCGGGLKAWHLKDLVESYIGFDSSDVLINFLKSKIVKLSFTQDLKDLRSGFYDLAIISSKASRWSVLSVNEMIEIAKNLINENGKIVIELPYPDVIIPGFEKLRYEDVTFLVSKNNNIKISNLN